MTTAPRALDTRDLQARLMAHPLYGALTDEAALRTFLRAHVFCVWDFQSLLKSLQRSLTCVELPWRPQGDPEARRLVNEIVLDEESDLAPGGGHLSHYELYVQGMREGGADTAPIEGFLAALGGGADWRDALAAPGLPAGVAAFVRATLELAVNGAPHQVAAGFAHGRELVIPNMFRRLVDQLAEQAPERWSTFRFYLERHIECDDEQHGPASHDLVARLCGDDERRWREAEAAARAAIEARLALWDALHADVLDAREVAHA
ncbi:MAG: DUF3050 domain-containing protein [Planctomycetes bacterium]|nr:DUF3050 domain-containing protein [Planctomycetota bacterium]